MALDPHLRIPDATPGVSVSAETPLLPRPSMKSSADLRQEQGRTLQVSSATSHRLPGSGNMQANRQA